MLIGCSLKIQENQSTITVSGIGTVFVQPDLVQMNINFSYVAQTTQEAKKEVDIKMQQVLDVLKGEDIEEKDIKTISLSYDVETEYRNGRSVWIGQRAQQTIVVTIHDIINNPNKLPTLLDKITAIDRVVIRNIKFDVKDKLELFIQSRELAYQKAVDKANQYAILCGQKIVKVLTISEETRSSDVLFGISGQSNIAYGVGLPFGGTPSVPTGEQEVTSEVEIKFLIK
jgi:uncharacterized protein YggE